MIKSGAFASGKNKRHCCVSGAFARHLTLLLLIASLFCLCGLSGSAEEKQSLEPESIDLSLSKSDAEALTAKIDQLVTSKFLSKSLLESVWLPNFAALQAELNKESDLIAYGKRLNQALALLKTSHTQFLSINDEAFYFMRSLFTAYSQSDKEKRKNALFTGLGVGGAHAAEKQVRYVLDASPAALAGVKRGDLLVSINGFPYTGYGDWYRHGAQKELDLQVERAGKRIAVKIVPRAADFLEEYLKACSESARIINRNGKKIGYLHLWSGGLGSQELFEELVLQKMLDTEALILDLRDGYGAASSDYLDIFFRPPAAYPDLKSISRQEKHFERSYYNKPLIALINGGTRSGKELMAYSLKRSGRAKLLGEKTAGYVVGGQYLPLDKRTMLYLASVDIYLDGKRLEGSGVAPDIEVKDRLSEKDLLLEAALNCLQKQLSSAAFEQKKGSFSKGHK